MANFTEIFVSVRIYLETTRVVINITAIPLTELFVETTRRTLNEKIISSTTAES